MDRQLAKNYEGHIYIYIATKTTKTLTSLRRSSDTDLSSCDKRPLSEIEVGLEQGERYGGWDMAKEASDLTTHMLCAKYADLNMYTLMYRSGYGNYEV